MMRIYDSLKATAANGRASTVTVGAFDGVHIGHQALLARTIAEAERLGGASVAVTFQRHPLEVLSPESDFSYLTTRQERAELMAAQGLDRLVELEFTRETAALTAREFAAEALVKALGMRVLVCGPNHRFGSDRLGGREPLEALGDELGFRVQLVERALVSGLKVSSTRVRAAVAAGRMSEATAMLGRPYSVSGHVVKGEERGASLGFPTANVYPDPEKALPPAGVYAGRSGAEGAEPAPAVVYVGSAPTFPGDRPLVVECHLLDFSGDLRGRVLRVGFSERLRGDHRFADAKQLVAQIGRDIAQAREVLAR